MPMERRGGESGGPGSPGLIDSIKSLAHTIVDILHTRLELLVTEISEEQARLAELALIAALSIAAFFLGIVFAAFLVVVAFWDTPYRLAATAAIACMLLAAGVALWLVLLRRIKARGRLFAATLHELATDVDRLR